jgi:hypothetical protein
MNDPSAKLSCLRYALIFYNRIAGITPSLISFISLIPFRNVNNNVHALQICAYSPQYCLIRFFASLAWSQSQWSYIVWDCVQPSFVQCSIFYGICHMVLRAMRAANSHIGRWSPLSRKYGTRSISNTHAFGFFTFGDCCIACFIKGLKILTNFCKLSN